ncbi:MULTISPECIES: Uma2 family endonuclease [unclassified Schlesneria]|uniref:Uma2 family endonuclease n=2 Tax=Planctomycetaceae TaxID=126 RepID=UPI00359F2638
MLTSSEYLEIERQAPFRSEFFRGEMFAMAGGSARHSRIKTNLLSLLNNRLKGQPCVTYDNDLRMMCPTGLYTYPDASVICGDLTFDDDREDTALNPTVLLEVLSKSTEAYDRGKKFDHYRTIPTLQEYVLVSQDEPMVQTFFRNEDNTWTLTTVSGLDQVAELRSIGVGLPLGDVYDRVNFTAEVTESSEGDRRPGPRFPL